MFQFKIILTTTFLIIAVTSLNRPVPHWKLVFGYFKKFLLQKKKFFAVLVEVDPLKKKKVSGKYYGIRMKKAHGVHKTWVVAPVAPTQELGRVGWRCVVFTFVLMGFEV